MSISVSNNCPPQVDFAALEAPALRSPSGEAGSKVEPQDCIVIEDSRWGLEAAKAAGMHPVAVTNSYSAEQLKPADKIVANLGELTIADLQTLCL